MVYPEQSEGQKHFNTDPGRTVNNLEILTGSLLEYKSEKNNILIGNNPIAACANDSCNCLQFFDN